MITLYRVIEKDQIKQFLLKDDLYINILGTNNYDDWKIDNSSEGVILVKDGEKELGILIIKLQPDMYLCFHGGIYKEYRNKESVKILNKCIKKLKHIFYPLHIVTMVPTKNIEAIKLCDKSKLKYKNTVIKNSLQYRIYSE